MVKLKHNNQDAQISRDSDDTQEERSHLLAELAKLKAKAERFPGGFTQALKELESRTEFFTPNTSLTRISSKLSMESRPDPAVKKTSIVRLPGATSEQNQTNKKQTEGEKAKSDVKGMDSHETRRPLVKYTAQQFKAGPWEMQYSMYSSRTPDANIKAAKLVPVGVESDLWDFEQDWTDIVHPKKTETWPGSSLKTNLNNLPVKEYDKVQAMLPTEIDSEDYPWDIPNNRKAIKTFVPFLENLFLFEHDLDERVDKEFFERTHKKQTMANEKQRLLDIFKKNLNKMSTLAQLAHLRVKKSEQFESLAGKSVKTKWKVGTKKVLYKAKKLIAEEIFQDDQSGKKEPDTSDTESEPESDHETTEDDWEDSDTYKAYYNMCVASPTSRIHKPVAEADLFDGADFKNKKFGNFKIMIARCHLTEMGMDPNMLDENGNLVEEKVDQHSEMELATLSMESKSRKPEIKKLKKNTKKMQKLYSETIVHQKITCDLLRNPMHPELWDGNIHTQ